MAKSVDKLFTRKKSAHKIVKETFLIFCEWDTEKSYFNEINHEIKSIKIELKKLQGKNFETVAKEMVKEVKRRKDLWEGYDHIYCVFDNNNLSRIDYEKWISIMKKWNIKLIYSNKSFEIWILMHFTRYTRQVMSANDYQAEVKRYISDIKPYRWLFTKTKDKLNQAISNSKPTTISDIDDSFDIEPYTDMRKIAEAMMKYL